MENKVKLDDDTLEPVNGGVQWDLELENHVYRCTNPQCENYASDFPTIRCPNCGELAEFVR